jgi:NAD(P)-dependent dehydrogenase (short-subunit alcohol dehydrogenase family)
LQVRQITLLLRQVLWGLQRLLQGGGFKGITVNAVVSGFIQTEMTDALPEKVVESYLQQIPLGRLGTVQDVSETVYWLCSESASYITGQIIHVNGGLYIEGSDISYFLY